MSATYRRAVAEPARIPKSSNEFGTPKEIWDTLNKEFNFTFDLASQTHNKKTENAFCIDRGEDSLKQDWHKIGGYLWLNPPYKPLRPWIEKAQREADLGAKIVMLIPPIITTHYFQNRLPNEIRLIAGRIKFINETGKPMKSNAHDSCILVFDNERPFKVEFIRHNSLIQKQD